MLDLNSKFSDFNEKITLTKSKKENLKTGRDALRDKVKASFKDEGRNQPKFCGQGSYMMKTTTNPINGGEYDIDDGVYLQGYSDKEQSDWPSTYTAHNWIKKAIEDHTSKTPIDKNTCVRVVYAGDYHIDLPAYIEKDGVVYLAHNGKDWTESDPKSFTDWFIGKVKSEGEQLRSIVKYLKAWKDYKGIDFKGIAITILVGENYSPYENRDDLALLATVTNILSELEDDFKCTKPVAPGEDIFEGYSQTRKDSIINGLKTLKSKLHKAVNEKNEKEACNIMRGEFGDRFPKSEDTEEKNMNESSTYARAEAPAIIKNDGRSA